MIHVRVCVDCMYSCFIYLFIIYLVDKYRLLHGIFHIIPLISPNSWYQLENRQPRGMIYEWGLKQGMIWKMLCYDLFIIYFNTIFWKFTMWHVINLQTLTERHIITFRKHLINLLYQPTWAILVKLGEINMIPLIILNKTQKFCHRVKF